jgi:ABC-type uncharacterized transport system fused permease/ATPase subunit
MHLQQVQDHGLHTRNALDVQQGKIEFGVINQSQSAFNHVLNDLSLVVYQVALHMGILTG